MKAHVEGQPRSVEQSMSRLVPIMVGPRTDQREPNRKTGKIGSDVRIVFSKSDCS